MHVPPKMPDAAAASPAGTWAAEVEALPPSTLHTLARWALGEWKPWISDEHDEHPLPAGIIAAGPAQIIDHTIEHHPESLAARFWKATRDLEGAPDLATARQILNQEFLTDPDWRRGWAIAALRALDLRSTWDSDGILLGLEYARNRLSHPDTVAMILLQSKLAQEEALDQPLLVQYSPFAEPEVQAVLSRLDQIVAAQERQPDRPAQVLSDVQSQGPHAAALLQEAAARHLQPGFELQGRAGSTVAFLLRALMEDAETGQQFNKVHQLKTYVLVSAARYGTTADWLAAAHRCTATQARLQPTEKVRMMVKAALEHFLVGATWLGDASLQATMHHGLGLLLRDEFPQVFRVIEGVRHLQRALTLRRQIGETIAALGSQIDLSSLLIELAPFTGMIDGAPPEVEQATEYAEMYLTEAIEQLAALSHPTARSYLGEALMNRARLCQVTHREEEGVASARAALALAAEIGNADLAARAQLALSQLTEDPHEAMQQQAGAVELIQRIRKQTQDEFTAVAWVVNKAGLFDAQLELILRNRQGVLDDEATCAALIDALEEGRGLTYNRWLGVERPATYATLQEALQTAPELALAVYAVTPSQVAVVTLTAGEPPRLQLVDMGAAQVEELVAQHLAGLNRQRFIPQNPRWSSLQAAFLKQGVPLVAPLEPLVQQGKTLCLIAHRGLHSAALHTLPTSPGGVPIGLRTPVFTNPSLTSWLAARAEAVPPMERAFVGGAWPPEEEAEFGDGHVAETQLRQAGFEVVRRTSGATDLAALAGGNGSWRVLHLDCHGVFRMPRREIGLLLAADGQPPPPPVAELRTQGAEKHLATPEQLRTAGVGAHLAFLASCLSARNEELPGDDLLGVTRALFAGGTADLIAGGWTVVSRATAPFVEAFYQGLHGGRTTAEAMLHARQRTAETFPDPFLWGCFIHQGANSRPLLKGENHD